MSEHPYESFEGQITLTGQNGSVTVDWHGSRCAEHPSVEELTTYIRDELRRPLAGLTPGGVIALKKANAKLESKVKDLDEQNRAHRTELETLRRRLVSAEKKAQKAVATELRKETR